MSRGDPRGVPAADFIRALEREGRPVPAELRAAQPTPSRRPKGYQLPKGTRYLTDAERAARRAARADAGAPVKRAARQAMKPAGIGLGDLIAGWFGTRPRRARRRRRRSPPAGVWRMPR